MDPEKVVLNRNLLNQILIEEGMDPARVARISVYFTKYSSRNWRNKLWTFLLLGDAPAGHWSDEHQTAWIYPKQHRSASKILETLAHELGHALDQARTTYFWPTVAAWAACLTLMGGASWRLWPVISQALAHQRFVAAFLLVVFWIYILLILACCNWILINGILYRPSKIEKSARRWEKKLTARPDWERVLIVGSEPEGGN